MSPFFRGGVRPPRRKPRTWSMNPRLNPDSVNKDAQLDKKSVIETTETSLPLTNSLHGPHLELVAGAGSPTTYQGPVAGSETREPVAETHGSPDATDSAPAQAQAAAPVTDSTETSQNDAEDEQQSRGGARSETSTTQPHADHHGSKEAAVMEHVVFDSNTHDSEAVKIIESPIINHFVNKDLTPWESPRVSSTCSSSIYEAEVLSLAQAEPAGSLGEGVGLALSVDRYENAEPINVNEVGTALESPLETPFETPFETMPSKELGASVSSISGEQPLIRDVKARGDQQTISSEATNVSEASAAGEPLMDDAQLEVSDEFKPEPALHTGPSEPVLSDEQLSEAENITPLPNAS